MTNGLYDIEMHVNPFGINSRITYSLRVYSIMITIPCLISRRNCKYNKMVKENMINVTNSFDKIELFPFSKKLRVK